MDGDDHSAARDSGGTTDTDHDREDRHVVGCVLRRGVEVLACRRSDDDERYPGLWDLVSAPIGDGEGDTGAGVAGGPGAEGTGDGDRDAPERTARLALAEVVGSRADPTLVRRADPIPVPDADPGNRLHVHPFCFEVDTSEENPEIDVDPGAAVGDHEWVQPPALLDRGTVPWPWTAYRAVAPTVADVRADETHGSAYVSLRALEVLRDGAAEAVHDVDGQGSPASDDDLAELARRLRSARPDMAVVRTRIDRTMAAADRSPAGVLAAATDACERAVAADGAAAETAAAAVGDRVLTLSRSGTVLATLRRARPGAVVVAESRPAREGVGVAESLAADGLDVALCVDAAMAHVVDREGVETVLVGADAVLADGTVVNKTGSRLAALAAHGAALDRDVDTLVVCSRDKVVPEGTPTLASGPADAVYDGDADVRVRNPTLEAVPPGLVDGVATEDGVHSTDEVEAIAAAHAALADWID